MTRTMSKSACMWLGLSVVLASASAGAQVLTRRGGTNTFALAPANAGGQVLTGGGAINTVPVFTGSFTLGNSPLTVSGSNVGIGTSSPSSLLNVNDTGPSGNFDFYAGQPASALMGWAQYVPTITKSSFVSINDAGATSGGILSALSIVTQDNSTNGIWGTTAYGSGTNSAGTVKSFIGGFLGMAMEDSTGTVAEADGGEFLVGVSNGGATITNAYAVRLLTPQFLAAGATISNNYGLEVDDQVGGQTNFAIKTGLGTVSFGDLVGLGTTTPHSALEVNGSVTLTPGANGGTGGKIAFSDGTVQSTAWNGTTVGGDYAESIDVLGDRTGYQPGDVIVIDESVTGKFNKSDKAYSKLVAGVYSTKPGLVGRRVTTDRLDKNAEVPMAMMGIVPTKVTAENGSIERGDLLVSSSVSGYAMKGTDRDRLTGAVIGKALAPLASGSGVIEVLLALQ